MIITGFSRSGASLLLSLLHCTVKGRVVDIKAESSQGADRKDMITKNPAALTEIESIDRPVIMVRDPRDVVTSRLNGDYFVNGDFCLNQRDAGIIPAYHAMQKYPDTAIFRYEHLLQRPDQFQDILGNYWGLEYMNEFSTWPSFPKERMDAIPGSYKRKMGGSRPIGEGQHTWRDHMQRIREQFDHFPELHEVTMTLGYVQNDAWYEEVLENTEPQAYRPKLKKGGVKVTVNPKPAVVRYQVNQGAK